MRFSRMFLTVAGIFLFNQAGWAKIDTVKVQDYRFVPATQIIQAGDTVLWRVFTECCLEHTVTRLDSPMSWDSGPLPLGGTFRLTFPDTGSFPYSCQNHEYIGMTGTIIVQPHPTTSVSNVVTLGWLGLALLLASLAVAAIWILERKRKSV